MSAVIVLTPLVIANWSAISAAIVGACTAAGFAVNKGQEKAKQEEVGNQVELQMENMQEVTGTLARDQQIVVERAGVRVVFSRDGRGNFKTCVTGPLADEELRKIGEELAGKVVQQYVYQRLTSELQNQGFVLVQEEQGPDQSIKLQVRRFG